MWRRKKTIKTQGLVFGPQRVKPIAVYRSWEKTKSIFYSTQRLPYDKMCLFIKKDKRLTCISASLLMYVCLSWSAPSSYSQFSVLFKSSQNVWWSWRKAKSTDCLAVFLWCIYIRGLFNCISPKSSYELQTNLNETVSFMNKATSWKWPLEIQQSGTGFLNMKTLNRRYE